MYIYVRKHAEASNVVSQLQFTQIEEAVLEGPVLPMV